MRHSDTTFNRWNTRCTRTKEKHAIERDADFIGLLLSQLIKQKDELACQLFYSFVKEARSERKWKLFAKVINFN